MKNKWRFFAVTLAVVLCMTVFSVTAYAGGGDMVDSTMGDPTMETPTATTQPENTNTGEQTPNGQTLTVLVTENADGSHTVTIGDRSWTLPAKREQAGKVVNVRTYLNLRTGPGTDYTVIGHLLNGAEVKVLEESNGWYTNVYADGGRGSAADHRQLPGLDGLSHHRRKAVQIPLRRAGHDPRTASGRHRLRGVRLLE